MSPDQKGIETFEHLLLIKEDQFTMSPDQKGIETFSRARTSKAFRSQ